MGFIAFGLIVGLLWWIFQTPYETVPPTDHLMELIRANQQLKETIRDLKVKTKATTPLVSKTHGSSFISVEPGQGFRSPSTEKISIYIPRGAVFKARLITSIKTSVQDSFVIAETTATFEMDSRRRIERGSRLIGSASLDRILKGVVVRFDTLVTPKGIQYDGLALLALSEQAYPMIEGIHFSDAGIKYGTALAFGFLSGFATGGMERENTITGSAPKQNLTNQALSGLSIASFKVADEAMNDLRDEPAEYVVVPAGADVYLAFERKWELGTSERGVTR